MDDENVPPNMFYNIPLKKISRQYNFFSKKAKKLKMTKKLKKIHLPGISVKILLVTKTFPKRVLLDAIEKTSSSFGFFLQKTVKTDSSPKNKVQRGVQILSPDEN